MLSTARCKVQTHYGQVLAYKTPQSREKCEQSLHCCSSHHLKKKKSQGLLLFSEKKLRNEILSHDI